ncbi:phosphatase PAP2 family protein [Thiocapsa imhoffii]|uniref:phosphatase PAP2 family protein n=1 Tax=Thiocapsa imhoffii TaxID=382777 RepID=UPI0030B8E176
MTTQIRPQRRWPSPGRVLLILALLGTLPFWLFDLDIQVASLFYRPGLDDPWPTAQAPLWSFLYSAAPLLAGLLLLGGLLAVGAGLLWPARRHWRWPAVLVIATTLLGPGLIVNGLFKDHWGRPRPHQIEAFGGSRDYRPPLVLTQADQGAGKSFPCGHSSVGFVLGVFFFLWRQRRPTLAWGALAGSLLLGTLFGIGRMAAGDHFLSDVIWSAVFTYGTGWLLHDVILKIPRRDGARYTEDAWAHAARNHPVLAVITYQAIALAMVVGLLLATPLKTIQTTQIGSDQTEPTARVLRIIADQADVILFAGGDDLTPARVRLEGRGFGLPWSRIRQGLSHQDEMLTYQVHHEGLFTEKDTRIAIGLFTSWTRVEIDIVRGSIRIHEETGPLPRIEVRIGPGTQPNPPSSVHRLAEHTTD